MSVQSFVGSFVGDGFTSATPYVQETLTDLTTTSGSTITANGSNSLTIPAGYNGLTVWAGARPIGEAILRVWVKIDSGTAYAVDMYYGKQITLKVTAGQVVAFGTQTSQKTDANTFANASTQISVVPTHVPASLDAPTGTPVTVSPDQINPMDWSLVTPQLLLADECQIISIAPAAYRRDLFIIESKGDNITPMRHVHLPANETTKILCRYQGLFLGNLTGEDIQVTMPQGGQVLAGRHKWQPTFEPTASTTVSTVAALKTAMNGSTYDDILLTPGTYDMSGASVKMNTSNYFNAMGRNLRIRSTTGNPADVVFTGAPWRVILTTGYSWILQGVSWNLDGVTSNYANDSLTGMLNFDGAVHLCDFAYYGAPTDASNDITQISWRSTSQTGPITVYAAWGTVTKGARDNVTMNSLNSQAATLHLIGTTVDGCGPNSNDQLLTAHSGASFVAWGVRLKNLSTSNNPRVAPDSSTTPIYLQYCYSRSEDFTTGKGLSANGIDANTPSAVYHHFSDFPKVQSLFWLRYALGCRFVHNGSNGPLIYAHSTTYIAGCDLTGNVATSATGFEMVLWASASQLTVAGSRVTHSFTIGQQDVIRIASNTTGNKVLTLRNVLLRSPVSVANSFVLNVGGNGSGGTHSLDFKNVLIDTDGSMQISSSAAASTSDGSRFRRASAPTNWTTKVTAGTNTFSSTALDLSALDVPTSGGNCDAGIDPGYVGSCDIYGRPFLGGTYVMGCAERQEIRGSGKLLPDVWG